jgi:hypothetical protein
MNKSTEQVFDFGDAGQHVEIVIWGEQNHRKMNVFVSQRSDVDGGVFVCGGIDVNIDENDRQVVWQIAKKAIIEAINDVVVK